MNKHSKYKSFDEHLKEELKNPVFKAAYEKEGQKLKISYQVAVLRQKAKMSQRDMAKKMGVSQAAIGRIEMGEQNLTLETMMKIAKVFKKKLVVKFV